MNSFTFDNYKNIFQSAINNNYNIITLKDYFLNDFDNTKKTLINRVDVDYSLSKTKVLMNIFSELNIKATFFFRLHSVQYNLFSFDGINLVHQLIQSGHEIGIHTELIDMQNICNVDPVKLLKQEIRMLEELFKIKLYGTAAHGDMTGYNNLDFWAKHKPSEFRLLYEAYDQVLWKKCRYISDSQWTSWKAYDQGILLANDLRSPIEHFKENVNLILMLTHPDSYYHSHFHEIP